MKQKDKEQILRILNNMKIKIKKEITENENAILI